MMDEKWLPNGELDRPWYYAHLISWVIRVVCIALHLLINAKVGGLPLLLSMLNWRFRANLASPCGLLLLLRGGLGDGVRN